MWSIKVDGKGIFYVCSRIVAIACVRRTWPGCKIIVLDGEMQAFEVMTMDRGIVATVGQCPVITDSTKLFDAEVVSI